MLRSEGAPSLRSEKAATAAVSHQQIHIVQGEQMRVCSLFFCFLGKLWSDWNTLGYARLRTPLLLVVTRKVKNTICCGCVENRQQYVVKSEDRCGPQNFDRDKIARQKEKNSNQGASAPKMLKFLLVLQR